MAAPSTALSRRELHATYSAVPSAIPSIWWDRQLWKHSRESSDPSTLPICLGGLFSFRDVDSESVVGIINLLILVW